MQFPVLADGSNVGLNDAVLNRANDFKRAVPWFDASPDVQRTLAHQGSARSTLLAEFCK